MFHQKSTKKNRPIHHGQWRPAKFSDKDTNSFSLYGNFLVKFVPLRVISRLHSRTRTLESVIIINQPWPSNFRAQFIRKEIDFFGIIIILGRKNEFVS